MDCSGRCCIFVYKFSSLQTMKFTHFHVHSQYSILDGAASIPGLIEKAKADGQAALALTDHGNMFGIKLFYDTCRQKGIKPILGCEAYVARVSLYNKEKPVDRSGEHLIILAKNLTGYRNLVKLCSTAFCDGFYYRPRIDKTQLEKHHEGLIISSACLGGEIDQKIMAGDLEGAEKAALWYKNLFGEDYYIEIQDHNIADQKRILPLLVSLARSGSQTKSRDLRQSATLYSGENQNSQETEYQTYRYQRRAFSQ